MNDFGSVGVASPDHIGHDGPDLELLRARVRVQWADALEHEDFGDDEDFFEAGGNSCWSPRSWPRSGRSSARAWPCGSSSTTRR